MDLLGQPAAAKAVPTGSVVGLSGLMTLSGLEQLEAQQEVDDEYDPLILVGCVLEVPAWPCSGVCDTVWCWWQVQRSEGGRVREVRVKNFEQGHYRLRWIQRGKTTRVLRHGILRYKKFKVLKAPDAAQRQGSWSQREKAAVVARRKAGEGYKSIALSFGRTVASMKSKGIKLLDPSMHLQAALKVRIRVIRWAGGWWPPRRCSSCQTAVEQQNR